MSVTLQNCRVSILVKALPQRSANHGETVCCAGVTAHGEFKRLFPIRFRHLSDGAAFKRWDWVDFKFRPPTSDRRAESCHVMEDSITVNGSMSPKDRASFLSPLRVGDVEVIVAPLGDLLDPKHKVVLRVE